MMTPQEVSQRSFPRASFGGYSMAMVDEFLDALTEDYSALYKENAMLKSKMKVLAEKIEEYRSTEDAMRTTLLTAQKMANSIVEEAKEKRTQLLQGVEEAAQEKIDTLRHELTAEQTRLAAAKNSTASFIRQMKELYDRELSFLNNLPNMDVPKRTEEEASPDKLSATISDIDSSLQKLVEEEMYTPAPQPEDLSDTRDIKQDLKRSAGTPPAENPETSPAPQEPKQEKENSDGYPRKINFDNLQFGREFEIK
ncbi:MAG: DivIVA domain-containing protein [Oscillospiraceae bacterium]|nr:DivIVA domain-containing protein [Oscillospiraceae bacterium]